MREAALDWLVCPDCAGALRLEQAERAADGHVMTGLLACAGCPARYPVTRGIPRLLAAGTAAASTETAARFATEWTRFSRLHDHDERWLRGWLDPLGPAEFAGRAVLEGGCGKGRHSAIAARWGARTVVALDLGDSVEVAFANTRALPQVHVVQGDLLRAPVRRGFDLGFSVGVLHHLPQPRAGFLALLSRIRPGGTIAIWVYGYESNEWIVRLVNPVRERVTARMPARLLYWLSLVPTASLLLALPLYRSARLSQHLPYRDYLRLLASVPAREVHSIVFDQLVTPIAYYLPRAEVASWFADAGLRDVRLSWHNRNSWRGSATVPPGAAEMPRSA